MRQIEIKRKFFDVIEPMGERSFKVARKNNLYFLKQFGDDKKGFEKLVDDSNKFKICGLKTPKVYMYDKNSRTIVIEYIEGVYLDQYLSEQELTDDMYKALFDAFWYVKNDKMYIDFKPGNFKYYNDKLYYMTYKNCRFENKEIFLVKDLRYWFSTGELRQYLNSRGLEIDQSRIKKDYEVNKQMALMTVKYYH